MKAMLIENQYLILGLMNGTIGIIHKIVLNHDTPRNDTLFIKPPLHILVDLNFLLIITNLL